MVGGKRRARTVGASSAFSPCMPLTMDSQINEVLDTYLLDPSWIGDPLRHNPDLPALAKSLRALPVYADMGCALLIRPTGQILSVHSNQAWDEHAAHELVSDPFWVHMALTSCETRFPSLSNVVRLWMAPRPPA
jgi:hypothetical protein